jgi:hypothetical protein
VSWFKNFRKDEKGNVAVVVSLCLPVLIGSVGLGVETSFWQFKQREMQTAVDMAAYAGAVSLRNHEDHYRVMDEVSAEAVFHNYNPAHGLITTNMPPLSGESRNDRSVEVILSQSMPRLFSAIFLDTPISFEVRAVSAFGEESDACILALSPSANAAVDFFGNSDINMINCEVMSNSIAPDAVRVSGSTNIEVPCFNSVGGFVESSGGATYNLTSCAEPRTELPRALDPYSDVNAPSIPSLCSNIPGGPPGNLTTVSGGPSGVKRFCNGLNLTGDYHFEPGVYIIDGGQFRIAGLANVTSNGATFYLRNGAQVSFNGSAHIEMTAPTSGEYSGLVFFGDRNDFGVNHSFNGTANSAITGSVYLSAGDISFLGDFSGENGCMQLVGNTVAFAGNALISTDCTGVGIEWSKIPSDVRLVE